MSKIKLGAKSAYLGSVTHKIIKKTQINNLKKKTEYKMFLILIIIN